MSSYTITIAADDAGQATTTLKVEVTETAARITELLVRAGHGEGLTAGQVPAVDLDLLLRAVVPATQAQPAIPAPAPAPIATPTTPPATAPATGTRSDSAETAGATTNAAESPSTREDTAPAQNDPAPAAPAETGPADAAEPAPEAKTTPTRRKASRTSGTTAATRKRTAAAKPAPVAKTTSRAAKAAKPKKTSDAEASGSDRVYRRSPEDLDTVFQQVGTVAGIADHYNVPRYTAQGWVRTLRRKQTVPNSQ